ncbi:hypothetical protein V1511DRAFT_511276 [Dipodascopsis uninucleata]
MEFSVSNKYWAALPVYSSSTSPIPNILSSSLSVNSNLDLSMSIMTPTCLRNSDQFSIRSLDYTPSPGTRSARAAINVNLDCSNEVVVEEKSDIGLRILSPNAPRSSRLKNKYYNDQTSQRGRAKHLRKLSQNTVNTICADSMSNDEHYLSQQQVHSQNYCTHCGYEAPNRRSLVCLSSGTDTLHIVSNKENDNLECSLSERSSHEFPLQLRNAIVYSSGSQAYHRRKQTADLPFDDILRARARAENSKLDCDNSSPTIYSQPRSSILADLSVLGALKVGKIRESENVQRISSFLGGRFLLLILKLLNSIIYKIVLYFPTVIKYRHIIDLFKNDILESISLKVSLMQTRSTDSVRSPDAYTIVSISHSLFWRVTFAIPATYLASRILIISLWARQIILFLCISIILLSTERQRFLEDLKYTSTH